METMELYNKGYPDQIAACESFRRVVQEYPQLKFYQPSPAQAPWHWQVRLSCEDGTDVILNFWPHTWKVQPHYGGPPMVGYEAHIEAIDAALDYVFAAAQLREEFQVLED